MIPFHSPHISGKEKEYISEVIDSGKLSGNGSFTKKCHSYLESTFGFKKVLLTNSCTDALEMCCLILNLQPGDEIILPSYTFVSTANAFNNFGINLIFCDSEEGNPNMDISKIEEKITSSTKAIVVMHYAGIACKMEQVISIAKKHKLFIIEDAALGLGSRFMGKPLGGFGDLGTFSFHQTKNITCGEGGLLVINNPELISKSEIIWEKGTNRAAFLRGESDKYEWVSKGSSFLTSEIHAAFLYAQLEKLQDITLSLVNKWNLYQQNIIRSQKVFLPNVPDKSDLNGSIFYLLFESEEIQMQFISFMKAQGISVLTHYRCLHKSIFFKNQFSGEKLINCENIARILVRLPLYVGLKIEEQLFIIDKTNEFINTLNL